MRNVLAARNSADFWNDDAGRDLFGNAFVAALIAAAVFIALRVIGPVVDSLRWLLETTLG